VANNRIKLTRKSDVRIFGVVVAGKFIYIQISVAVNFAVNLCGALASATRKDVREFWLEMPVVFCGLSR
jgi:hypothetical protein